MSLKDIRCLAIKRAACKKATLFLLVKTKTSDVSERHRTSRGLKN